MIKWLLLTIVVLIAVIVAQRFDLSTLEIIDESQVLAVVVASLVLALVSSAAFSAYQGRLRKALLDLMAWVGVALALIVGYSYRHDLTHLAYRVAGELLPPGRTIVTEERADTGERSVRIRRRGDGHFIARAEVVGVPINMLVDTGATTVVLRAVDAKTAGIDTRRLTYSVAVQTANGTAYAASIRLGSLGVGSIVVHNVDALVAQPGTLKESLLGMSFLRRLRSYEFSGEFLTFRSSPPPG